jgi:tripartite-type tricarboxylate transporter receptor subunit TctC
MPGFTRPSALLLAGFGLALAGPAAAQTVEEFYKGKTIDLVISFTAGGGYDAYARLMARHIGDHIPGKPTIVPRNMPGGGGRVAGNYLYNVARKDGTVLAVIDQSLALEQARGDKTIQFDAVKFNWIGNPAAENNTTVTWHTSPVKTIEDAKKQEVPIGATGNNTSAQFPKAMNALVGTKFKVVYGYPGGNDINLAMERGEVAGRGSNSWGSWKGTRPDWIRDKKINILVQIGLKKTADLPDVPLLMDLASNPEDKAVLRLLSSPTAIGRPLLAPPGVPADRVKALRAAFDAMLKDPAFIEEAKKQNLDIEPVPGEELQQIVAEIAGAPKASIDRLNEIIGPPQQ